MVQPLFLSSITTWNLVYSVEKLTALYNISSKNASNKFFQPVVDARREGDENPLSCVVLETLKLLVISLYSYQVMNRSRHTITKCLNHEKLHKAIHEPLFKQLKTVQKDLYEIELLKSTIEQKEPIIVGVFILQFAKLSMLEL